MNSPVKLTRDLDKIADMIRNDSVRHFTKEMVFKSYANMKLPASTRHHLLDEREEFGNLLHSVRVASLCVMISDAAEIDTGYSNPGGRDVLLSAAILHDVCRHGLFGMAESSRPDHPRLVRVFADQWRLSCDYFDEIMRTIETHMGRWSQQPVAFSIDAGLALHLADLIIARWAEVMPPGGREDEV